MGKINGGDRPALLGHDEGGGKVTNWGREPGFTKAKGAAIKFVAREIGEGIAKLMLKKAASRLAGKMFLESNAWKKALVHIVEHFSVEAAEHKAIHSVFLESLRSPKALNRLVSQALKSPTRKVISRATFDSSPIGRPVVIIEREFAEVIGESYTKVNGQIVKKTTIIKQIQKEVPKLDKNGKEIWVKGVRQMQKIWVDVTEEYPPCKILRIIVDYTGRPISAMPVNAFSL